MLSRSELMRVAVLTSGRGPGVPDLLSDPARGRLYELVCVLSSATESAHRELLEAAGVPLLTHPLRSFCMERGARWTDRGARVAYDRRTAALLAPFRPELVLLSGYLLILTRPMLRAFRGRIVNVHASDWTDSSDWTDCSRAAYPGLRAVRAAIAAGETETRATAHLVTERVDAGPALIRSRAFPVSPLAASARRRGDAASVNAYAFAHQEWMLFEAWGPLLRASIRLAAGGRLSVPHARPAPLRRPAAVSAAADGRRPVPVFPRAASG